MSKVVHSDWQLQSARQLDNDAYPILRREEWDPRTRGDFLRTFVDQLAQEGCPMSTPRTSAQCVHFVIDYTYHEDAFSYEYWHHWGDDWSIGKGTALERWSSNVLVEEWEVSTGGVAGGAVLLQTFLVRHRSYERVESYVARIALEGNKTEWINARQIRRLKFVPPDSDRRKRLNPKIYWVQSPPPSPPPPPPLEKSVVTNPFRPPSGSPFTREVFSAGSGTWRKVPWGST